MFTGIIENLGTLQKIEEKGTNKEFWVQSTIAHELKIDQSLAHNGVCLTVVEIQDDIYKVVAIQETLIKSQIGSLKVGDKINLERSLSANGRIDGHFVQGHVDTVGKILNIEDKSGSWLYTVGFPSEFDKLMVSKGSICMNGISLTVIKEKPNEFQVAIIPYTFNHTNLQYLQKDSLINLEFDILGKYIQNFLPK